MRVGEVMTHIIETVSFEMNLTVAAKRMKDWGIGFLPVVEKDAVVGVITDRDITLRGLGAGHVAELTSVREIMTPFVLSCHEDEVLTDAAKIMEKNHVRRLLVLDSDNRLVGLLSLDDLAAHMSSDRLLGTVLRKVTATE